MLPAPTQACVAPAPIRRWNWPRLVGTIGAGTLVWAIVAAGSVCVGSTGEVGWPDTADVLRLRMDVVLLASLIGACLGAAGVVYQAILRNPLADPSLLGVSSGAMLCAYVWRFPAVGTWLAAFPFWASAGQQAFAFVGALAAVGIVLLLSTRWGRLDPVTLILVGVIVNATNAAVFLLLNARFPELTEAAGGTLGFLVGGIQTNLTWQQKCVAAVVGGIGWIALMALAARLNVAAAGEVEAHALGVRIHALRWVALVVASILTAAAVAISGPIGFIGLICPHLARLVVGADHRRLLPWGTALGAALLCAADAVTRLLGGEQFVRTQLPVGVLTALLGGPFFLLLLWQSRKEA